METLTTVVGAVIAATFALPYVVDIAQRGMARMRLSDRVQEQTAEQQGWRNHCRGPFPATEMDIAKGARRIAAVTWRTRIRYGAVDTLRGVSRVSCRTLHVRDTARPAKPLPWPLVTGRARAAGEGETPLRAVVADLHGLVEVNR